MIVEVDLYVAAIVVGVGITLFILMLLNRRDRQVTDFVKEFERMEGLRADEPRRATVAPQDLVLLAPDVFVYEAKELADRFSSVGIRFEVRPSTIDNTFHLFGNSGMGTRMNIYVHPEDSDAAQIIWQAMNPAC
jgi:hypothetical protein